MKSKKTGLLVVTVIFISLFAVSTNLSAVDYECPACGEVVAYGIPTCPACGGELEWDDIIEAEVDIHPEILNLKSKGRWITAYFELEEDHDVNEISSVKITEIDGNPVDIPAETHPTEIDDYDGDGTPDLMVKFDRSVVEDALSPGYDITISGQFEVGGEYGEFHTSCSRCM